MAFAHAVVQFVAEEVGAEVLHIKGPAVELEAEAMRGRGYGNRGSVDADVLVRPSHVQRLERALAMHGWTVLYEFEDGSPFEHAATLARQGLANADLHRYFPGVEGDPEKAFERLWASRRTVVLAGRDVCVPSIPAQRMILILHAARGRSTAHLAEVREAWLELSPADQLAIDDLARDVDARVALAAGTGRLDTVKSARSHDLWLALSEGEASQARLWRARVRAAPSRKSAMRTGLRLLLPKRQRLAVALGRPPTTWDMVRAFGGQIGRGTRALARDLGLDRGRRA
ncbi:2-nitropropane dioxygenase [Knoellia sinensis KCTC 19936]|uniref:2-nitropropane dioxygenase n=1 Tax=Knoellia sinensis KCTC 19936 TaxID=1385520 RepID=A0A0A0JD10_9MICO|nr:2-nitropropane dioxygenase [Knoellia sinensis KCTC 19936]